MIGWRFRHIRLDLAARPAAAKLWIGPIGRAHDLAQQGQALQAKKPPLRAMRDLDGDTRRHERILGIAFLTAIPRMRASVLAERMGAAASRSTAAASWEARRRPAIARRASNRPDLVEMEGALALPVAAALVRELIHAAVGLLGPMRATTPGPAFLALIAPILEDAGPLPLARLHTEPRSGADSDDADEPPVSTRPRKQANRHVRCACPVCGYVVRTARKWLDQIGPPLCPLHGAMLPDAAALSGVLHDDQERDPTREAHSLWVG